MAKLAVVLLIISQKRVPPPPHFCFPALKCQNLVPHFFVVPPTDLWYSGFPHPQILNLCITGYKLNTNTLNTCVISCNTQEQKQVEANLDFKYTNKHIQFTIIYPTSRNS